MTTTIPTNCPRCGRTMTLPVSEGIEPADLQRIAKLVLCDDCSEPEPEPVRREVRSPMADP